MKDGPYGMHGKKDHLEDGGVAGRTMLQCFLNKQVGRLCVGVCGLE